MYDSTFVLLVKAWNRGGRILARIRTKPVMAVPTSVSSPFQVQSFLSLVTTKWKFTQFFQGTGVGAVPERFVKTGVSECGCVKKRSGLYQDNLTLPQNKDKQTF